jgi:hypothetical protein
MASIFDTIRLWADGQNALNASAPARGQALQRVISLAVGRLQRHGCLADLASGYYADAEWWPRLAEEFDLSPDEAAVARGAAYWQRFMEIRHPSERAARV